MVAVDRRRHGLARDHVPLSRASASSNGRCSCRSPSRPTSSPTPISTCCIRSGRCRRRCASSSASRGRAISGSRKSARSHGCIFLLGVVLYPYVYLPVRALFLMQSAATLEVARTLGANRLQRLLPRGDPARAPGDRGRRQPRADGGAERHRRLGIPRHPHADRRDLHDLDGAHERRGRGADRARHARRRLRADPSRALGAAAAALFRRRRARHHTPMPQPLGGARRDRRGARLLRCRSSSGSSCRRAISPSPRGGAIRSPACRARLPDWIGNSVTLAAIATHRRRSSSAWCSSIRCGCRAIRAAPVLVRVASIGYAVPGTVLAVGLLVPLASLDNAIDAVDARRVSASRPG